VLIPDVYLYVHLDTSRVHNVRTLCAELSSTKKKMKDALLGDSVRACGLLFSSYFSLFFSTIFL
jgi:hypothetical protein